MKITRLSVRDIRFPTSNDLSGSDAMNPDPDYSAAYVVLETDSTYSGHGLTFTLGRGTEIVVQAVKAIEPLVVGRSLEEFTADMGKFWRHVTGESQLRWIGPEKGSDPPRDGARSSTRCGTFGPRSRVNRYGDWSADLSPEEFVRLIDFRYITDALTPDEARGILEAQAATKPDRIAQMQADGYPAYTTSAGWLGYSDDKISPRSAAKASPTVGIDSRSKSAVTSMKIFRRCRIIREEIGDGRDLMTDANQVWDVAQAIEWMQHLVAFKPLWIEEPTSPDDVLGHKAIRDATKTPRHRCRQR